VPGEPANPALDAAYASIDSMDDGSVAYSNDREARIRQGQWL
jgi:hypothetical protein